MAMQGFTRTLGIAALLLIVFVVTTVADPNFIGSDNLYNILRWSAFYGVLALGVAFVIITGGIDLSIGSVVALSGITLMILLQVDYKDSGIDLTIAGVDKQTKTLQLVEDMPAYRNLDRLAVPNPGGADDILLTIDAAQTEQLDDSRSVVVRENVSRISPGDVGDLQVQSRLMNPWIAVLLTLLLGTAIGLFHGLLIGYGGMQPFIITLCGLLAYRSLARIISNDEVITIGSHHGSLRYLSAGQPFEIPIPFIGRIGASGDEAPGFLGWVPMPMPMLILLILAFISGVLLHKMVHGRYMLAMGRSLEAARFSGINTRRVTLMAYVICSTLAALGGILFALDLGAVTPATDGNFYELYAIAAAVLGGCSLRGGVGSIRGVILGTIVIITLYSMINFLGKSSEWRDLIIGVVLLLGIAADELGRKVYSGIKTRQRRKKLSG
ncbi:MAG: ABC transporter permease [Planctomycetota bacterium]